MGDDAVGLAQRCQGCRRIRGQKHREQQNLEHGKARLHLGQRAAQVVDRQMGKDRKGQRMGDAGRQAGEVEIAIFDQMIGGQAGGVGKLL